MIRVFYILISLLFYQSLIAQNLNNLSFGTDTTFDIVSWNIEWFPKNNFTADYVETILTNIQADIYALQEINDTTKLKQISDNMLGYESYFVSEYYGGLAYLYNTNNVEINDRYEIFTSQSFWHIFPRSPQVIDLNYNGKNYIIINNHFKCCGDGYLDLNDSNDEENRRLQAVNYLKQYIDNNFAFKNVILVGDLNDNINDFTSNNVFQSFIIDSNNYIFTDMQIAQGSNLFWSYPTWPSHLDHILISNELFPYFYHINSEVSVIKVDDYMSSWNYYEYNVSDHRPIGLKLYHDNLSSDININKDQEEVITIIDVFGRKVNINSNGIIFYIYKNGKVEKRLVNREYK